VMATAAIGMEGRIHDTIRRKTAAVLDLGRPMLLAVFAYWPFARLAASIKFSVARERNFFRYAMPTPSGGGGGCNGRTFNRELARPLGNCAITAMPLPDSTAAIRLRPR